jgi:hypothetical protein
MPSYRTSAGGHYELATDTALPLRLATAFTELALAM